MADGAAANYFDGRSAAGVPVRVSVVGAGAQARLFVVGDRMTRDAALSEVTMDERVGPGPRFIQFTDGASLEIADPAFDSALARARLRVAERGIGRLERRWSWAIAAVVLVVAGAVAIVRYGAPAAADRVARAMPAEIEAQLGSGGLALLDSQVFEPTALAPERQRELQALFARVVAGLPGPAPRLEFRSGGSAGANAFALPAGIVVLTDELVALAEHDDELAAVLAHEVGHLQERHSLRLVLQSSAVAALLATVVGDVSGSTVVLALPSALLASGYSRDFEREADAFAYAWLERNGIPPSRLADLLERLAAEHGVDGGYLSTHPPVAERRRAIAE